MIDYAIETIMMRDMRGTFNVFFSKIGDMSLKNMGFHKWRHKKTSMKKHQNDYLRDFSFMLMILSNQWIHSQKIPWKPKLW